MTDPKHHVDLGQRFGKLVVTELGLRLEPKNPRRPDGRKRSAERAVRVRCDCGTERIIKLTNLVSPKTLQTQCNQCLTGMDTQVRSSTQYLYHLHRNILLRCQDPKNHAYPSYGGRGILLAPEWQDLADFSDWILSNLGERPTGMSFDRIDVNGNYEPGNVRWATVTEQQQNKRPRRPGRHRLPRELVQSALIRYDSGGITYGALAHELGVAEMSLASAVRRLRRSQG